MRALRGLLRRRMERIEGIVMAWGRGDPVDLRHALTDAEKMDLRAAIRRILRERGDE